MVNILLPLALVTTNSNKPSLDLVILFKNTVKLGLFLLIYYLFTSQSQHKLKKAKHRCSAWDSIPGLHDCRYRWIH